MKKLKKRTKVILICLACLVVLGLVVSCIILFHDHFAKEVVPTDLKERIEYYAKPFYDHLGYYECRANKINVKLNDDKTEATIKIYYDNTEICFYPPKGLSKAEELYFLKETQPLHRRALVAQALPNLKLMVRKLSDLGITLNVYIYAYKESDNLGNPQYDTLFHGIWTPERLSGINWGYMTWRKIDDSALHAEKSKIFKEYMDE